jgi:argininosuccinate lyase
MPRDFTWGEAARISVETISAEHMVSASKGLGGPQLAEVTRMLADGYGNMKSDLDWLKSRKDGLAAAESALNKAVAALATGASTNG